MYHNVITVMFEWNARLDLSEEAATKTFGPLLMEFLLEVLCQSTWTVTIWVIRGDKGVGDIPGVQGGFRGVCRFCTKETQLTQELRLRV